MPEKSSDIGEKSTKLTAEIRRYIEKRIELLTLSIVEKVSHIMAESFQRVLGLFVMSFALFFLWFSVGFLLAELIGSISAGFAIASIPLFIIGYILMTSKSKRVTEKVQAQLIRRVLEDLEKDQDKEPKKIEGKPVEQE